MINEVLDIGGVPELRAPSQLLLNLLVNGPESEQELLPPQDRLVPVRAVVLLLLAFTEVEVLVVVLLSVLFQVDRVSVILLAGH
jgi:hypothetical protein